MCQHYGVGLQTVAICDITMVLVCGVLFVWQDYGVGLYVAGLCGVAVVLAL